MQFDENLDSRDILKLIKRTIPYYLKSWKDIDSYSGLFGSLDPSDFNMRAVGLSSPVIEYVVRPHLQIIVMITTLLKESKWNEDVGITREEAVEYLNKGLNWVCETHITGSKDVESFLESKRWGRNWRSSMWTSMLAISVFLGRDDISDSLYCKASDVIAYEADRFIGVSPPSGYKIDTKIEENALDTMLLAWALNLFPDHKNAGEWQESFLKWALNIAVSIHDEANHSSMLDSSVSRLVEVKTLFPDMTAENHGFFNPEILSYTTWIVLAMAAYVFHGREIPSVLQLKNHQQTFEILLRFSLPSGMIYSPSGQDMPLFAPHPFAFAWGIWHHDPRALRMAVKNINWISTFLKNKTENNPWVKGFNNSYEGWNLLFQSQTGFELAMIAVLPFPEEMRFYSSGQIENAIDTCNIYPYVQLCYRRNSRATRSIAWKAIDKHPEIGVNIHSFPELIVTANASLLGIPVTTPKVKYSKTLFHNDSYIRSGFDSSGSVCYYDSNNEKIIKRSIRVLTWGENGLVVFDKMTALKDIHVGEQYLSPLHLVNDVWTGEGLNFVSGSLREFIKRDNCCKKEISCPSFWASIENHLLFQFIWGRTKGLHYIPGTKRNYPALWNNCRLDKIAVHVDSADCSKGESFYQAGFFVGAGKSPRPFKCTGNSGELFKGLVIMDGKSTIGLT